MLGRRDPQQSLFSAQQLPHRVPDDSFYGRMGRVSDVLFSDDDLKDMYDPDNGRPSLPPSLMCGVLLLQFHDDVSDEEAVQRTLFDLRWKVALNLPLDYAGFDSSSLTYFRKRLAEHGKERYAFDRFVAVGRAAGFIPDRITLLTDTTWAKGAGAAQDTYTLLRKGIRKLLKALGYDLPSQRSGLAPQVRALVTTYLEQNRKADIDWADPQQRAQQLKVLVQDAEAALDHAAEYCAEPEVRASGWLLTKILGDDIVCDDQGDPQIGEGTAPDRIVSVTDPEMRYGHKSRAHLFTGFKVAVALEPTSDMLLDIADVTARGSDGEHLLPTIRRVEAQQEVTVERVIGDNAYGSAENLAACANYPSHPVELITSGRQLSDAEVAKAAFRLDLQAQTATCPEGQTVAGRSHKDPQGRPQLVFAFSRRVCKHCRLFERCVQSQTRGRTVYASPFEAYVQVQQQRQQTAEYKALYRMRSLVERPQAELVHHGLRRTRYLGQAKRQLQRLWSGAVLNFKRLSRLAEARAVDLRATLQVVRPHWDGKQPVLC